MVQAVVLLINVCLFPSALRLGFHVGAVSKGIFSHMADFMG